MKRDLDLIRKILQACEEAPSAIPGKLSLEGHSAEEIGFHIYLLGQAGLMETNDQTGPGDPSPNAQPVCLTWAGYEFLEASRNDGVWSKAKGAANASGGMAFEVLKAVLIGLCTQAAMKATGL